ncbi:MAG: hypothetical protein KAU20_04705 [Nanoarchaeota archaeon]|nr:hypothetical protein [Nanoarchaeota archaeon]
MKLKNYITEKKAILFIILLAVIILSIIPVIRFLRYDSMPIGDKPYYDARISEHILEKGMPQHDSMIYGGRDYLFNPYHFILAGFSYIFGISFSLILLPFLTGLLSAILFYLLLKKLKVKLEKRFLVSIILILSPVFIYIFSVSNRHCASVFLILLGFYLFLKKGKVFFILSLIIFLLLPFFNFLNSIVVVLLLFAISKINKERSKQIKIIIALILIISVFYYTPLYFKPGLFEKPFAGINEMTYFASDLGGLMGFSIFAIVLALIGIGITWKYKKELAIVYLIMILLFLTGFYLDYANIYLNFFIAFFAGIAFLKVIEMRWQIKLIRNLTLLLLIYGILFSVTSYVNRVVISDPNDAVFDALDFLDENSNKDSIVFSHYTRGFWIEYKAKRQVVMDSLFDYYNAKQRFADSNNIFCSRDLEKTKSLLNKYNVDYIFVDSTMKKGMVWERESGLWYLFRNKETFNNIYDKKGVEVWEYLG